MPYRDIQSTKLLKFRSWWPSEHQGLWWSWYHMRSGLNERDCAAVQLLLLTRGCCSGGQSRARQARSHPEGTGRGPVCQAHWRSYSEQPCLLDTAEDRGAPSSCPDLPASQRTDPGKSHVLLCEVVPVLLCPALT